MSGLRHCPLGPGLENGRPPARPRPERAPPLVSRPGNRRGLVPAATLATTKPPGRVCPGRVAARQARPATGPMLTTPVPWARRLFGIKCAKCQVGFSSSDLVMRARDSVYHIECFRCSVCSRQLLPGDEFSLREHELLCRADHGLLLERAAAGSPRSPGPLPGARGLHLPGKPALRRQLRGAVHMWVCVFLDGCLCSDENLSLGCVSVCQHCGGFWVSAELYLERDGVYVRV